MPKKFRLSHLPKLIKQTYVSWNDNDPWRLSAVVAYYTVLSLPGLLVIIINVIGAIWGEKIIQGYLTENIANAIGPDAAQTIKVMISETQGSSKNLISTIIGVATIIFGATGVLFQLQISLNKIWDVKNKYKSDLLGIITNRARSFAFILVIGFLLLVSFIITTALSTLNDYIARTFLDVFLYLAYLLDVILSIGVISTLFALMFKFMPDARISWKIVWIGAIITALLFVLGKFLLGLYFGMSDPTSTYGAAGSIVLILLWVSYSCLIFFFGAQFTKVYSDWYRIPTPEVPDAEKGKLN